jgi:predicted nucleic acid-binding protein
LIVVDASAVANALTASGAQGESARARLRADTDQHAPALLDLEVASVVRRLLRSGAVDGELADQALDDLRALPLARYPHLGLMPRIWGLRHNLTAYDASYVALAEALGAVLVTADARLANTPGLLCEVEVLT